MKNIEKYTNTKDALEAYDSLCNKKVTFYTWLELEYEEPRAQTLIEAAQSVIDDWYATRPDVNDHSFGLKIIALENAIDREKAKPVRNCDKYKTAEDAYRSFLNFCKKGLGCLYCRFKNNKFLECSILWAYEEAENEDAK